MGAAIEQAEVVTYSPDIVAGNQDIQQPVAIEVVDLCKDNQPIEDDSSDVEVVHVQTKWSKSRKKRGSKSLLKPTETDAKSQYSVKHNNSKRQRQDLLVNDDCIVVSDNVDKVKQKRLKNQLCIKQRQINQQARDIQDLRLHNRSLEQTSQNQAMRIQQLDKAQTEQLEASFPKCPVCLENLNSDRVPQVLPCGHVYCQKCFKVFAQRGTSSCPTCKKKFKVSSVKRIFFS